MAALTALECRDFVDVGGLCLHQRDSHGGSGRRAYCRRYRFPNIAIAVRCIGTNRRRSAPIAAPDSRRSRSRWNAFSTCSRRRSACGAAELRARNLVRPQDMPYRAGTSCWGKDLVYENADFPRALASASRQAGYTEQVEISTDGDRIAYGIGCGVETGGAREF